MSASSSSRRASPRASSPDDSLPDGLLAWFDRMSVSGRGFSFRVEVNGAVGAAIVDSDSDDEGPAMTGAPVLAGLNNLQGEASSEHHPDG
jgi:hypothetical protein